MPREPAVSKDDLREVFDERVNRENPFLTTGDVARELGVSTETARKWLREYDGYVSYNAGRGQIWFRQGDDFEIGSTGGVTLRAGATSSLVVALAIVLAPVTVLAMALLAISTFPQGALYLVAVLAVLGTMAGLIIGLAVPSSVFLRIRRSVDRARRGYRA